jgi:hypothetical protein
MKNYHLLFEKRKLIFLNIFKTDYESKIKKAGDISFVHNQFKIKFLDPEYKKAQNELGINHNFINEVNEAKKMDKGAKIQKVFNFKLSSQKIKKREQFINDLAKLDALNDLYIYLHTRSTELIPIEKISIANNVQIKWKGNNETEFVQIFYSLFLAGYISNKEAKITSYIPQIASLFDFPLSQNWSTSLSKSIHNTKSGYQPRIFKNIEETYLKYQEELINKKKQNSSK